MSVDPKILDRLAKLMELAESSNEHEAELAAQRAGEMMAKHQLDSADIEAHVAGAQKPKVERGRIDAEESEPLSRIENWHKALLSSLADVLGAKAFFNGRGKYAEFRIIGPADSVSTGRYLYLHLSKQVSRLSRDAQRRHLEGSNAWRRAYSLGMVARLWERLKAGRAAALKVATTTALVWVDKTKLAIAAEYDQLSLRSARAPKAAKRPDAKSVGYFDGDRVDIGSSNARAIGEGQKKLRS